MLTPELNGLRIRTTNDGKIYLIDEGKKRWISNSDTYIFIFKDMSGVINDLPVINEIDEGAPITSENDALLSLPNPPNEPDVYFVDYGENKCKRLITKKAFEFYNW